MTSLLNVGNTYNTISGHSVLLLDKEYSNHDIIIYKGVINVDDIEIWAYFTDSGCCIICDNLFLKCLNIKNIEDLDILLTEDEIVEAYNKLPKNDPSRSEIMDIITEALDEFKKETVTPTEQYSDEASDETHTDECYIKFLDGVTYRTIMKLEESLTSLHSALSSSPYCTETFNNYITVADHLRRWVLAK